MNKQKTNRLIRALRTVAEGYYNKDGNINTTIGLCKAIADLRPYVSNADCCEVLLELRLVTLSNQYLCEPGTRWDERALFALVFAEYLEGEEA